MSATRQSEWLKPSSIIALVTSLGALLGLYVSFDRRVTTVEASVAYLADQLREEKAVNKDERKEIRDKLDEIARELRK